MTFSWKAAYTGFVRNSWTLAGSDAGGRRAAAIYTLIETAKLNDTDPQAWLTDVLARLQDRPAKRIAELLPWNWKLRHHNKLAERSEPNQLFNRSFRGSRRMRTPQRRPRGKRRRHRSPLLKVIACGAVAPATWSSWQAVIPVSVLDAVMACAPSVLHR
jgi:hypothetical protein